MPSLIPGVQMLAANLDLVVVTTPADRSSAARVEREIAVAWDSGAVPLVVVTEADLDVVGVAARLAARLVGVDVLAASVVNGEGIAELRARLRPDRTAVAWSFGRRKVHPRQRHHRVRRARGGRSA